MMSGLPSDYLSLSATYPAYYNYDSAWQAANTKIKTFLCPSDDPYSNITGTLINMVTYRSDIFIGSVSLSADYKDPTTCPNLGRTNYIGVAGYSGTVNDPNYDVYTGAFSNRSAVNVNVSDGASTTLLFGEWLADSELAPRNYAGAWMGCGTIATFPGINPTADSAWYNFSSKHPNIVNFVWADGHVAGARKNLSPSSPGYTSYIFATGIAEGQYYPASDIDP